MTEIYLIRHAETDFNKNPIYIGGRSSFLPINETGIEQCKPLRAWLINCQLTFDAVFCSSSNRAKQTLWNIYNGNFPIEPEYTEELEELSQGEWQGKLRKEIYTPEQLAIINVDNYRFKAPEGESQEEVENRMFNYLQAKINELPDKRIMVVSHGVAIKCLLRKILDFTPKMTIKIDIDNCSITKLSYSEDSGWKVHFINRVV